MKLKRLVLFGGNAPLIQMANLGTERNLEVHIFTDPLRLQRALRGGGTLKDALRGWPNVVVLDAISAADVAPVIDEGTMGFSLCTLWIFDRSIIDLFTNGHFYNYHSALLPFERGAGAYSWKILLGDRRGGLTFHRVAPGVDEGDIVLQDVFDFPASCRVPEDFFAHIDSIEPEFLRRFLDMACSDALPHGVPQDPTVARYFPGLYTPVHGMIDWSWSAQEIERFVSAFDEPYRGAATWRADQLVLLKKARTEPAPDFHPFQAGIVFRKTKSAVHVACRGGALLIDSVRDETGNDLIPAIHLGTRFHTPSSYLERAMTSRVRFRSWGIEV